MVGVAVLCGVWAWALMPPALKADLPAAVPPVPVGAEVITLGSGCFWKGGAVFQQIPGVLNVTAGYMGGDFPNPTYEQVGGGLTGHTEVSRIVYDPTKCDLERILAVFWATHDPTHGNARSARSVIFCDDPKQREVAERSKKERAANLKAMILTEVETAGEFYAAEKSHQDYYGVARNGFASCPLPFSPELKSLGIGVRAEKDGNTQLQKP